MALLVQKYGGTSVGSIERIKSVAERVGKARDGGDRLVVVVSAMAGETNRLFRLAAELSEAPDARETDVLVATGEQAIRVCEVGGSDYGEAIHSFSFATRLCFAQRTCFASAVCPCPAVILGRAR